VAEERREQQSYELFNGSIGIKKGSWGLELFAENIFDKRAELFINTQDDIPRITTNRPRTVGLNATYRFLPL
jgi:outer membrane receptor protein involved in Fe transport